MLIKLLFKNKSSIAQNKTYILLKKTNNKNITFVKKKIIIHSRINYITTIIIIIHFHKFLFQLYI